MVLFSPSSGILAVRSGDTLWVRGHGGAVTLTGRFADEFTRAFTGQSEGGAPSLEELASLSPAHRPLLEWARAGGAIPWVPLSSLGSSVLFLEVVGRCNEQCLHCYAEASPQETRELSREICLEVIREGGALGFERLQLTGGDPLLCGFLPELAAAGKASGFNDVEIYTNGLALTPELLDQLAPNARRFAFSFYSHDEARHDERTRVPGSHRRTSAAIRRALERGLTVRVGVVAFDGPEEVLRTRQYLEGLGVGADSISVDEIRTVGRGEQAKVETEVVSTRGAHTGSVGARAPDAPQWPGKLCVSYTGQVFPCIFARWMPLGDVRRERLSDIVARARARRGTPEPGDELGKKLACLDCRLTVWAHGAAG